MREQRIQQIKQIHDRLRALDEQKLSSSCDIDAVEQEMASLRLSLNEAMNSACPVIQKVKEKDSLYFHSQLAALFCFIMSGVNFGMFYVIGDKDYMIMGIIALMFAIKGRLG